MTEEAKKKCLEDKQSSKSHTFQSVLFCSIENASSLVYQIASEVVMFRLHRYVRKLKAYSYSEAQQMQF